ncbi:condensation domain-containing protein [Chitinophaga sp. 212800010-3]|uniref:condensation domain-containing protein n=1 Tax=unclassified Chitinophaga TaxID=2619133 RepID=UPI002DEE19F3|nr:Condensation domain-containing protein [Chitinophaga sp. 212800010-3]
MTFEKLQLDNVLQFIDSQLQAPLPAGDEMERRKILLSQKTNICTWSAWFARNPYITPIHPAQKSALYEPSAALKHFWTGYFLEKKHVPFNVIITYDLPDFREDIFRKTCEIIIKKHEILRTVAVFSTTTLTVKQKILPEVSLTSLLTIVDISHHTEEEKLRMIREHTNKATHHIFEYGDEPYYYFTVLTDGNNRNFILFNISHSIFDGFSKIIFRREFLTIYSALAQRKDYNTELPEIQYKDFSAWENSLQRQDLKKDFEKYWCSENDTRFPTENLSTFYGKFKLSDSYYRESLKRRIAPYLINDSEETISAFYGVVDKAGRTEARSYRFTISGDNFLKLKEVCKNRSVTIYPIMICALNILIYKKTRLKDIVIGSLVAIRDRPVLQKLIGCFVNTILVRNKVNGCSNFNDLLSDSIISSTVASTFKYYTMSKMLDDMDIPFNAINTIYLNMLPALPNEALTDFSPRHLQHTVFGHFDIDMYLQLYTNGVEFTCHYDINIYSQETIVTLFDDFLNLMILCMSNPDIAIDDVVYQEA